MKPRTSSPKLALFSIALALLPCCHTPPRATNTPPAGVAPQTEIDEYTRYELGDPATHSFRITHEFAATTAGARKYYVFARAHSALADPVATDLFTGAPLAIERVDGDVARAHGVAAAVHSDQFLEIALARPVPEGGEVRVRLAVTYTDADTYSSAGDTIRFERVIAVRRLALVLPPRHELVVCNEPVQVRTEADGRLVLSLIQSASAAVAWIVAARALPPDADTAIEAQPAASDADSAQHAASAPPAAAAAPPAPVAAAASSAAEDPAQFDERAHEATKIIYFLRAPQTHAFRLAHDFTQTRAGEDKYLNVVRPGSRASDPVAHLLDTGAELEIETLHGADVLARGWKSEDALDPQGEVVVVHHPPVEVGHSLRLRIEETYTDNARYGLRGDTLVWHRSFGRAHNVLVLPPGWYLSKNAIPATVRSTDDGRIRLDFVNPRPDLIDVYVEARRTQRAKP